MPSQKSNSLFFAVHHRFGPSKPRVLSFECEEKRNAFVERFNASAPHLARAVTASEIQSAFRGLLTSWPTVQESDWLSHVHIK